jgi:hypothetical protein
MCPHFNRINRQTPVKKTVLSNWKGLFSHWFIQFDSHQKTAISQNPPKDRLPLAPETFRFVIQPSLQYSFIQTLFDFPCSGLSIRHRRTREKRPGPFIPFTFPHIYIPLLAANKREIAETLENQAPNKKSTNEGHSPVCAFSFYSLSGFVQRTTGFLAACTSSNLFNTVWCGASCTISGFSSASLAI